MFPYTQLSLLTTVLLTIFSGVVIDNESPYFPIEISRTATGPISSIVFPLGALTSFIIAWHETRTYFQLSPFFGFFILAFVSDKQSWAVHMGGVVAMVVPIAFVALQSVENAMLFGFLMCLYLGRIVMKIVTIYPRVNGLWKIFERSKEFMYHGGFDSPAQEIAFKMGGVLQWAFLYGVLQLFVNQ